MFKPDKTHTIAIFGIIRSKILSSLTYTAQKMKFSIKAFFSLLRIWSHLLKSPKWKTSFFVQGYHKAPVS